MQQPVAALRQACHGALEAALHNTDGLRRAASLTSGALQPGGAVWHPTLVMSRVSPPEGTTAT